MKYSEEEVLTMLKDEKKHDEFFSSLTGEDVKKILLYVNSRVRNIPVDENKFCEETMCAGGLVSPDNEIQNRYFEKISNALKNVKVKKDKATMMYYLINELHLFEDGNGRTSRAIFDIINNPNFSFDNNDALVHEAESDVSKIDKNKFQSNNDIEDSQIAEICSNCFLYKALIKSNILPNTDFYAKKTVIKTDADQLLEANMNEMTTANNYPVFVPDKVIKQISSIQYSQIQNSLADNNGDLITTSGMALLLTAIRNGKIGDLVQYEYGEEERLVLPADRENETGQDHLSQFEKEDYFKIIETANILKEGMLDMLLDFFEKPNNFKFNSAMTMKDILNSRNIDETTIEMLKLSRSWINNYEISQAISQGGIIDITGTRTEKTMQVLSNYIENNIVKNENVVEVSDIGKQVISEMSDPNIEDETQKQEKIDMEKIKNKETQEK